MKLINPWFAVDKEERKILLNELKAELHSNHMLSDFEYELIGRRHDRDDILLNILSNSTLAIVHLTWKQKKETGFFPQTEIISIPDFIKQMKTENELQ